MQREQAPLEENGIASDAQAEYESESDLDPLLAHAVDRIAYVLNDLKRNLDDRDGDATDVHGSFQLVSGSRRFHISIATNEGREEAPVIVNARFRRDATGKLHTTTTTTAAVPTSPAEEDGDGARKRRRLHQDANDTSNDHRDDDASEENANANVGTTRYAHDQHHDIQTPLDPEEDLQNLIAKLRDSTDPQGVEELQSLIHRLHSALQTEQRAAAESQPQFTLASAAARAQQVQPSTTTTDAPPNTAFPDPSTDPPSATASSSPSSISLPDLVKQQRELLSKQIQWVEECRRVANNLSDQRTETWRTTSASFHDINRVDRERFQHRMIAESQFHTQTLNQILAEVRAIGLHTQSLKWETPGSFASTPVGGGAAIAPAPSPYRSSFASSFQPARPASVKFPAAGPSAGVAGAQERKKRSPELQRQKNLTTMQKAQNGS